jgi:hypothetical protein
MAQILLHNSKNWQVERRNTLSLGYCFSVNIDAQGKPHDTGQSRDTDLG